MPALDSPTSARAAPRVRRRRPPRSAPGPPSRSPPWPPQLGGALDDRIAARGSGGTSRRSGAGHRHHLGVGQRASRSRELAVEVAQPRPAGRHTGAPLGARFPPDPDSAATTSAGSTSRAANPSWTGAGRDRARPGRRRASGSCNARVSAANGHQLEVGAGGEHHQRPVGRRGRCPGGRGGVDASRERSARLQPWSRPPRSAAAMAADGPARPSEPGSARAGRRRRERVRADEAARPGRAPSVGASPGCIAATASRSNRPTPRLQAASPSRRRPRRASSPARATSRPSTSPRTTRPRPRPRGRAARRSAQQALGPVGAGHHRRQRRGHGRGRRRPTLDGRDLDRGAKYPASGRVGGRPGRRRKHDQAVGVPASGPHAGRRPGRRGGPSLGRSAVAVRGSRRTHRRDSGSPPGRERRRGRSRTQARRAWPGASVAPAGSSLSWPGRHSRRVSAARRRELRPSAEPASLPACGRRSGARSAPRDRRCRRSSSAP